MTIETASMRPRVFPAEDPAVLVFPRVDQGASMRPRVFPAEDHPPVPRGAAGPPRFNEAAGIPRGRPGPEDYRMGQGRRFNEAAGIPRGRPVYLACDGDRITGFNEAAGIPRGRQTSGNVQCVSCLALQ